MVKKYYEEAALIFTRGNLSMEAVAAWEKALNWKLCLAAAHSIAEVSRMEFQDLCRRLVARLVEERRYGDAACILVESLDDVEEAIAVLSSGHCWSDSLRLIKKSRRADLMGKK